MAMTNVVPDWLPEEIFSPRRLLTDEPLFLTERKGLWRVAATLCQQIQNVNRKLSEALTLQQPTTAFPGSSSAQVLRPAGESRSGDTIEPETLGAFDAFRKFSPQEIRDLLRLMHRWDLRKGTIIFTEGSPGGTCFVILEGAIDVSINAHGQHQLLTTLDAGAVFGQMSLIEGVPRSATCSVRSDAVLLEIEREPCEELLHSGSTIALKFLATLNEGLISALRGADLRLMQLDRAQFQCKPAETPRVASVNEDSVLENGAGAGAFITVSERACAP